VISFTHPAERGRRFHRSAPRSPARRALSPKSAPEIGDFDYDQLKQRLQKLEEAFPVEAAETADWRRSATIDGIVQPYSPSRADLSLDKTYAEADVRAFHARLAGSAGRTISPT